mmetsp:Transcript_13018/g.22366  ORF Transcript_13018/g.22366 Transcript_13018/m.22366 type:complete len:157 (-) Transcript_13018:722-1192(-)
MVHRFAALNASIANTGLDIISANHSVEIIDHELFDSLSTLRVLRSASGELVPSYHVRKIAELDSNLVILAAMIEYAFNALDSKLQSLHESSNRLSEKVPVTETSIITPQDEYRTLGIALAGNLMAVGAYTMRWAPDSDQDDSIPYIEVCQVVLVSA